MKIGLALGSGGARGIAHLGVLKAIEEYGLKIDFVSGSSMGAFVGAAYAAGSPLSRLEGIALKTTWQFAVKMFIPSFSKSGIVAGERISEYLYEVIGVRTFNDLDIPLSIDTTDLETGEKITIAEGDLIQAVRASIAVPLILTPKIIGDKVLVDGGLVSPIPIQTVREMGAKFIIAVDVMASPVKRITEKGNGFINRIKESVKQNTLFQTITKENDRHSLPNKAPEKLVSITDVLSQTIAIGHTKVAEYQILMEKPDILIKPDIKDYSTYEFHKGKELIDNAYEKTIQLLEQWGLPSQ